MKHLLSIALMAFAVSCFAADFNARVNMHSGVLVFMECQPVAKYEILGEINLAYTPHVSTSYINVGGMMVASTYTSKPTYAEMRNGLISQAVLANREVVAIIMGKNRATLIKFDPDAENIDIAETNRDKGLYYYIDAKPVADYDYVATVPVKGIVSDYTYPSYIENIQKRLSKGKYKNMRYNAIIYNFEEKDNSYAELIFIH